MMKKMMLFLVAGLLLLSTSAMATVYNFSITGTGTYSGVYDFTGTLDTTPFSGGTLLVTGGSLTSTGSAYNGLIFSVLGVAPGGSIRVAGGTDLIYDNLFTPGANPVFNGNGIVLNDGPTYLNIWGNSSSNYTVFNPDPYGGVNITADATSTPVPTPEPGTMMLLGAGFLGLAVYGKRRKSA